MECNTNILSTKNLSIGYTSKKGAVFISKDLEFFLKKGELVGLVGANGVGKSTLLRTLTKIQPTLSGSIFINGQNLSNYTNLELAKTLSVVLTEPISSKNLTVRELIALGRQPYTNWIGKLLDTDLQKIEDVLTLTDLHCLKNKYCYELSDGQLQIVMIARAIAQDTDIIILDEPTTHLDLYHKAQIFKILKELTINQKKAILFSSHEIDLCIQLCDRILVMKNSTIVSGTPCNLISDLVFEDLFPSELISFDANTGNFKFRKD